MNHSVIFVSLGPGDPELITLKGLKTLQTADYIFAPFTGKKKVSSFANDILLKLEIDSGKIHLFEVPMNKDRTKALEAYQKVAEQIAELYQKGHKIVVTAEGDAGFYSSIHSIQENLLKQNIPTQKIAGIPAFIACGALANLQIVEQEETLEVIPGVIELFDLKEKIQKQKTIVLMKVSQCESVIKQFLKENPDCECHYFENVGIEGKEFYSSQKEDIINREFPYFSLIIMR